MFKFCVLSLENQTFRVYIMADYYTVLPRIWFTV